MRGKKNRARPAAFAAGAGPDSLAPGRAGTTGGRARQADTRPEAGQAGWWPRLEAGEPEPWADAAPWPDTQRRGPARRPSAQWPGTEQWPVTGRWPAGGSAANGSPGNASPGNGSPGNGSPGNGHWPPSARLPGNGYQPGNEYRPENGQHPANGHRPEPPRWPGNGAWHPYPGLTDAGPIPWHAGDEVPRAIPGHEAWAFSPQSADCPVDSEIAGVAQFVGTPSAGTLGPGGARVRRNSLLRRGRRAGGGAMVRKATLDRSLQPDDLAAADEAMQGALESAELPEPRREQWRGAGGRWLLWTFRAVLWAVLLIIGFRGVMSIVANPKPSAGGDAGRANAAGTASAFPSGLAEAFALQFGNVYLNFSPATAAQRASELVPFIPEGSDPQFGWNGAGSQQLRSEQVASISVQGAHHAVVTLLAQVSSGLIELGVPIYAAQGGLVVSAEPALLPGPERATPPSSSSAASDPAAVAALTSQLPGFFRAYASGDQEALGRFLAPGAVVTGLDGAVTFGSISGMEVPSGGTTRRVAVSVVWQLAGQTAKTRGRHSQDSSVSDASPGLEMTYEMTVLKQHGSWYVRSIGPSPMQPGGP